MDVQENVLNLVKAAALHSEWLQIEEDPEIVSLCLDALDEISDKLKDILPQDIITTNKKTSRQMIRDGDILTGLKEKFEEMGVL